MRRGLAHGAWLLLLLAACGGEQGEAGASAAAVAPSGGAGAAAPTLPPMPADSAPVGTTAGATTGPRDSVPNTSKGPSGPTPLPMPQPQGAARPVPDTLRGVVAIVGAEPMTEVVLRAPGRRGVTLVGDALPELRQLAGVEVVVRGTAAAGPRPAMSVLSYAVRALDGAPAFDGVLARRGSDYALSAAGGTPRPLARVPDALRSHVGARIWVTTNDRGEVLTYGVITPQPPA